MILKFNIFDSTITGNETDTFNLFFDFMKGKVKFIHVYIHIGNGDGKKDSVKD
jgi:hypothetical protein